jgi:hypothetical protein
MDSYKDLRTNMITADTLNILTTFTAPALDRAVRDAGYQGPTFTGCRFLGITNAGQFCYMAVFQVKGGTDSTKVFLTYDHTYSSVSADYRLTELA